MSPASCHGGVLRLNVLRPQRTHNKRGNVNIFIVIDRQFCDIALGQKVYNNPLSGQSCTLFHVGMYTNTVYKMYFSRLSQFQLYTFCQLIDVLFKFCPGAFPSDISSLWSQSATNIRTTKIGDNKSLGRLGDKRCCAGQVK